MRSENSFYLFKSHFDELKIKGVTIKEEHFWFTEDREFERTYVKFDSELSDKEFKKVLDSFRKFDSEFDSEYFDHSKISFFEDYLKIIRLEDDEPKIFVIKDKVGPTDYETKYGEQFESNIKLVMTEDGSNDIHITTKEFNL